MIVSPPSGAIQKSVENRNDLLLQIQKGRDLRRVQREEKQPPPSSTSGGGMMGAMLSIDEILRGRRNVIETSSGESGSDSDSEWE